MSERCASSHLCAPPGRCQRQQRRTAPARLRQPALLLSRLPLRGRNINSPGPIFSCQGAVMNHQDTLPPRPAAAHAGAGATRCSAARSPTAMGGGSATAGGEQTPAPAPAWQAAGRAPVYGRPAGLRCPRIQPVLPLRAAPVSRPTAFWERTVPGEFSLLLAGPRTASPVTACSAAAKRTMPRTRRSARPRPTPSAVRPLRGQGLGLGFRVP